MSDLTETIKPVRIDLGDGDSLNLYRMSDYVTVVRFHGNNPNVQLSSAQVSTVALRAALDEVAPAGSYTRTDEPVDPDSDDTRTREHLLAEEHRLLGLEKSLRAHLSRTINRAEKAEQERDVLAERVRDFADSIREQQKMIDRLRAEQPRPLTPDAMTAREHLDAAWDAAYEPECGNVPKGALFLTKSATGVHVRVAPEAFGAHGVRLLAPLPPARPEGAEELGELIGTWTATEDIAPAQLPTGSLATLADFLAERGVRVVGEERS